MIFQAFDVSGKTLHGKLRGTDYAYTVNGTSANSILLVKPFNTLEPLGSDKYQAKTAAKEGQVRCEY